MGRVADVMVASPVCAHGWQTLADLRRTMLVNDYSVLPLSEGPEDDGSWRCVRAEELAAYFAEEDPSAAGQCLTAALTGGLVGSLSVYRAKVVVEDTPLASLLGELGKLPAVVTRRSEIVGIVTAFDLL